MAPYGVVRTGGRFSTFDIDLVFVKQAYLSVLRLVKKVVSTDVWGTIGVGSSYVL